MSVRVARLFVYPVKSCAGIEVTEAEVGDRGFIHDRRFLVVSESGEMITQRTDPVLAMATTRIEGEVLVIGERFAVPLEVPHERRARARVELWSQKLTATPVDDGGYFSSLLGRPARLVHMPGSTRNRVDGRYGRKGDLTAFSDGFPFLVVSEASLVKLADDHGAPVDVRRFRPNLVLSGLAPYGEDELRTFQLGPVTFHAVKPCSRCAIVDVDPDTGDPSGKVLRTLARTRTSYSRVIFGQNLVYDQSGWVRVGDVARDLS